MKCTLFCIERNREGKMKENVCKQMMIEKCLIVVFDYVFIDVNM